MAVVAERQQVPTVSEHATRVGQQRLRLLGGEAAVIGLGQHQQAANHVVGRQTGEHGILVGVRRRFI